MKDRQITFDIDKLADGSKVVKLNQKSRDKIEEGSKQKFEDLGTALINGVLEGIDRGTTQLFKHLEMPRAVQEHHGLKLFTITMSLDYLGYLADERAKYGDNGLQDKVVALSQTLVGWAFSSVSASGGTVVGGIPGAIGGAISASIIYDVKDVGGKPMSEWVGDAARVIYKEYDSAQGFTPAEMITDFLKNSPSLYVNVDGRFSAFPHGYQANSPLYYGDKPPIPNSQRLRDMAESLREDGQQDKADIFHNLAKQNDFAINLVDRFISGSGSNNERFQDMADKDKEKGEHFESMDQGTKDAIELADMFLGDWQG